MKGLDAGPGPVVGAADPGSPEAHRLLEEELRKLAYHQEPLVDRILRWIADRFEDITRGPSTGTTGLSPVVTTVVLLLVVGLVAYLVPKVQRERQVRSDRGGVLDDVVETAAELRIRARAAFDRGDHAAAVVDGYRALARTAADRTLLAETPGLTAHEVGVALVPPFPEQEGRLLAAAGLFDAVRYGSATPGREPTAELIRLDQDLLRARPRLGAPRSSAPPSAPVEVP